MRTRKRMRQTRKKRKVNIKRRRIRVVSLALFAVLGLRSSALAQDVLSQSDNVQDDKLQNGKKPPSKEQEPYGLLFGTAYGPDDRPVYGVRVTIHPADKKHPTWNLHSDHHGEFAQRVPRGPGDYLVQGEVEFIPVENGKPRTSQKKHLKGERTVHIDDQERRDFSLHLAE